MRTKEPPALHEHCSCVPFLQDDIAALKRSLAKRGVRVAESPQHVDPDWLAGLAAPDRQYMARKLGVKSK